MVKSTETKFIEIETKYNASEIRLMDYILASTGLSEALPKYKTVSSYDHYYYSSGDVIGRHRESDTTPELTFKQKTVKGNNFRRIEVNIPLSSLATKEQVAKACEMHGQAFDFSIFKDSHIFVYDKYNTVYYIVYSDHTRTKELGRFVEIEMDEHYSWKNSDEAWSCLLEVEKMLAHLGIRPATRLKKSLFEMFSKASVKIN